MHSPRSSSLAATRSWPTDWLDPCACYEAGCHQKAWLRRRVKANLNFVCLLALLSHWSEYPPRSSTTGSFTLEISTVRRAARRGPQAVEIRTCLSRRAILGNGPSVPSRTARLAGIVKPHLLGSAAALQDRPCHPWSSCQGSQTCSLQKSSYNTLARPGVSRSPSWSILASSAVWAKAWS